MSKSFPQKYYSVCVSENINSTLKFFIYLSLLYMIDLFSSEKKKAYHFFFYKLGISVFNSPYYELLNLIKVVFIRKFVFRFLHYVFFIFPFSKSNDLLKIYQSVCKKKINDKTLFPLNFFFLLPS